LPTKYKFLPILGSVTDTPEGTGTATNVQSSTRNSQSTVTPQKTTSAVSSSSSKGSSNTAAIAGGVVGGIVGAALIAAVVAWFTIRRRRARSAPSAVYGDGRGYMGQAAVPYPLALETPRLYVRFFFTWSCGAYENELIGSLCSPGPLRSKYVPTTGTIPDNPHNEPQQPFPWL
jgi:hypothetical protein